MKMCEINKRVENVCNYIIGGIEREQLQAKLKAMCAARARAAALEAEIIRALNKYEGV